MPRILSDNNNDLQCVECGKQVPKGEEAQFTDRAGILCQDCEVCEICGDTQDLGKAENGVVVCFPCNETVWEAR